MTLTSPPMGPVEWVALSFPGAVLGSGVAVPLADLVRAGTVRVLDAVVVHKAADGTVTEGEIADESTALDDVDVVPGAYTLEVSTPGISRPLTTARHYRRAEGRLVRLRTDATTLRGRVVAVDGEDVVIDTEGTRHVVALADIGSGTVEPELRPADTAGEG